VAAVISGCSGLPVLVPSVGTPDFLDANDFEGRYSKRWPVHIYFGGQSSYNGRIVFSNLERDVVEKVLPPDLRLAENMSNQPNLKILHPIALLFGQQADTRWIFPFLAPRVGEAYNELILIIPFVQKTNHTRWHNYVVRMYLDDIGAEILGNLFYGYQKKRANFKEIDSNASAIFEVIREELNIFKATVTVPPEQALSHRAAVRDLPNYQDAMEIFKMPVLGKLTLYPTKPYVCSYFVWGLRSADVKPIDSQNEFLQPFTQSVNEWVDWLNRNISSVEEGAFEIRNLKWRLRFPPRQCRF
jgi:hypothetical protein